MLSSIMYIGLISASFALLTFNWSLRHVNIGFKICLIAILFAGFSFYLSSLGDKGVNDRAMYIYHYTAYYSKFVNRPFDAVTDGFQQPGWALVNVLFRMVTSNAAFLFAFVASFYISTSLLVLKSICREQFCFSALPFLVSFGPVYAFSQSRQFLAISLCNIALLLFLARKNKRAILFVLAAVTVHSSALIMIPAFAFSKAIKSVRSGSLFLFMCICLVIGASAFISFIAFVLPQLRATMPVSFAASSQGVAIILKSLPLFLVAIPSMKWLDNQKDDKQIVSFSWVCCVISAFAYVGATSNYWLWRIALFFIIPTALLTGRMSIQRGNNCRLVACTVCFITACLALREFILLYSIA